MKVRVSACATVIAPVGRPCASTAHNTQSINSNWNATEMKADIRTRTVQPGDRLVDSITLTTGQVRTMTFDDFVTVVIKINQRGKEGWRLRSTEIDLDIVAHAYVVSLWFERACW
jgi:hypothetical protein